MREANGRSNQRRLNHEVSASLAPAWVWGPWLPVWEGSQGIDLCVLVVTKAACLHVKEDFSPRQRRGVKGLFRRSPGRMTWPSVLDRQRKMYLFVIWCHKAARPRPTRYRPSKPPFLHHCACFCSDPEGSNVLNSLGRESQSNCQQCTKVRSAAESKGYAFVRFNTAGSTFHWNYHTQHIFGLEVFALISLPCCCFTC